MNYRNVEKRHHAVIGNVRLKGYEALLVDVHYDIEGSKHQTAVQHTMEISFCEMRYLSVEMHRCMDELLEKWKAAKESMRGE